MIAERERQHAPQEGRRSTLRLGRKFLYGVIVCVTFFALLEFLLLVLGVSPVSHGADPFVGFSGAFPLFIEKQTEAGPPTLTTAPNRLALFNRQSFVRDKPSGTYRIFCLGGSTTYGRPYDDKTAFVGWLRDFLREMDPTRNWEVINAGGISYASYRIAILMRELMEYQPDLFIIYMGHNEFLEKRTYSPLIDTPVPLRVLGALASRSRTFSLMERLIRRRSRSGTADPAQLPVEVDAILDRAVGPSLYHRDDEWRRQVLSHFRDTLERLIEMASNAGAQVILVTPACNLRDCTPFKSEHRAGLAPAELREFRMHMAAGEKALAMSSDEDAVKRFDQALQIDPRYAAAHFLRGQALLRAGDSASAKKAFLQAREEDVCPLRAVGEIQETIRSVAKERNVVLVDFAAIIGARSEHGIPGSDWFLDHVHPTIEGHQLLARALLDRLVERHIADPQPSWSAEVLEQIEEQVTAQIDARGHAVALRNLAKVLNWAGKVDEGDRLALRAVEELPDDAETRTMAGFANLRLARVSEAKSHFEAALRLNPDDVRAINGLGDVYSRLGQHEAARDCFTHAVGIDPNHAPAQFNLGNAWFALGELGQAEVAYRRAVSLVPDYAAAQKNLGLVLARRGNIHEAVRHFEKVLELENYLPERHTDLGFILVDANEVDRAESEFRSALVMDPACVPAYQGLSLLSQKRNDLAGAAEWLRQAIRSAPKNANLHYSLAHLAVQIGDFQVAERELATVLKIDPEHSDPLQLRATILDARQR